MPYEQPTIHTNPTRQIGTTHNITTRTIYYGEVISIDDETDGGRIKVRIPDLDNRTNNDDLPWAFPMIPKFLHMYPQVGEYVRIFIEDIKYPQRSRFYSGSVISQLQKIGYNSIFNSLSTTNMGYVIPEASQLTYPDADGVFPVKTDIAIIGKVNTDVILRINEVHLRAGKHDNDNILSLNVKNPAEISLIYEKPTSGNEYFSNTIILSDKIAIISHSGNPKFKAARLETKDRENIFNEGHPLGRADVIVEAFELIRKALITHLHGYPGLSADKTSIINDLEKIDFNTIIQKNIVIN